MNITEELIKIFATWTKLKIRLHAAEVERFPEEKEIWWASLGQNVGVEINGKNQSFERPVLVVRKYNIYGMLVLPISSKIKEGKCYFQFIDNDSRRNIVNLSQLKSISSKRFVRKMGNVNDETYQKIKEELKKFI